MRDHLAKVREAGRVLGTVSLEQRRYALRAFAELVVKNEARLLEANALDLSLFKEDKNSSIFKRLELSTETLSQVTRGMAQLAQLPDPLGRVVYKCDLDTNLSVEKITVPLGVLAVIFESRPDVFPQLVSLALLSGNAIVLKGGKEAVYTNKAFLEIIQDVNKKHDLPCDWVYLVHTREAVDEILTCSDLIDLVVPRGSKDLVVSIQERSRIPVLAHAEGVCHLYVHSSADQIVAQAIVLDAKAQYPSACNAVETLLVDSTLAPHFLPQLCDLCNAKGIKLRGCSKTAKLMPNVHTVGADEWATEYGDLILAVKIVESIEAAIEHINLHGSHHTDGIIAKDEKAIAQFLQHVDSASVMVNASTRFADGFRLGLGAEVGISTSKVHARGPVGIEGLLSTKFIVRGQGEVVEDYVGARGKRFLHETR